ncbi:MAG: hypothetical protein ABI790_01010 [Betaproteobacteria bacterium]
MMNPVFMVWWQRYGLTAALGLASVVSVGVIGYETGWGQAVRPLPPAAQDAARATDMPATLPAFALPSLDSAFKETADRPLFTPTRRPAAVNLAGSAPAMKKGQFKLSGTSVNREFTTAFLLETATGKTVRVTRGKEINGITLDTVETNRVVLKQGEETEELTLRTASSPPAPPKVAAPMPGVAPPVAGMPAVAPPVAVVTVGAPPQAGIRPMIPPPNAATPAPGSAVLPGFVMPGAGIPAPTQAVPATEGGSNAQRRRRFQTTPQQ